MILRKIIGYINEASGLPLTQEIDSEGNNNTDSEEIFS